MKDGGQAFPVWVHDAEYSRGGYVEGGMSLRDYFAAKAMHAIIVADYATASGHGERLATWAYDIADDMLKRRDAAPSESKGE